MYLTQGLRRAQQIRPKATSTVFRGRRRTWSETAERVARFAGGLKAAGVRPGDRVAILALNSDRYFELMYALPWPPSKRPARSSLPRTPAPPPGGPGERGPHDRRRTCLRCSRQEGTPAAVDSSTDRA
jgi:non-ribosomal peptide synthetase component F